MLNIFITIKIHTTNVKSTRAENRNSAAIIYSSNYDGLQAQYSRTNGEIRPAHRFPLIKTIGVPVIDQIVRENTRESSYEWLIQIVKCSSFHFFDISARGTVENVVNVQLNKTEIIIILDTNVFFPEFKRQNVLLIE